MFVCAFSHGKVASKSTLRKFSSLERLRLIIVGSIEERNSEAERDLGSTVLSNFAPSSRLPKIFRVNSIFDRDYGDPKTKS